jgi:hypothetical protein
VWRAACGRREQRRAADAESNDAEFCSSRSLWEWLWPSITTGASARYAVKQGFWAAIVCTVGVAGVVAFNSVAAQPDPRIPFGIAALLDATAFATIAVGLSRHSRLAAICGLALYLIEQLYVWSQSRPLSPVFMTMFILVFTNAIRGTFALRRIGAQHDSDHTP